jgi:predicted MFS family arabinose efflux permease
LILYFFLSAAVVPFLLLRLVSGAAFCFLSTTAGAVVSDTVPAERLGEGIGFFAFSTIMGTALGPIFGLALIGRFGFFAFLSGALGIGLIGGLAGLAAFRLIPSGVPGVHAPAPSETAERAGPRRFSPSLCLFLAAISQGFILSYIHTLGAERNIADGAHFFTFYSLTVFMVRMLGSKLMDTLSPSALAYAAFLSLSLCFGVLILADSYAWIMASACFFGVGIAVIQPLVNMLQIKLVPPSLRGTANAAYFASLDLGVTVGSIGLGMLLGHLGFGGVFISLMALMAVAAAVFRLAVRPELESRRA